MARRRLAAYRDRISDEFERALLEDHTPREIATSFAFGSFVTMLPTLGTGIVLFVVIAAVTARVSRIALFTPVLIFNPAVKWGVYGTSFWLGSVMLGPVADGSVLDLSLSAGPDVAVRLFVGNLVLAVVVALVGYVIVLRLARKYRRRSLELTDLVPETITQ